jgi:NitT/TauT family transport system substrate-binding protein
MAKVRLNTGGKLLIVLFAIALIGVAVWQFAIPKKGDGGDKPDALEGTSIGANADGTNTNGDATNTGASSGSGDAVAVNADTNKGLGRPIKVGIVTWGGYAGGLYANGGLKTQAESIYAKKYGLNIEFKVIDDYPASRDAFKLGGDSKGGLDMVWGTVDSYALEYESIKDVDPKVIMQYDWSRGGDAVAVTSDIKNVADLEGKRIAVAEATPSHYFALYLLSQANMKTSDVNFVFTASAVEAAALFKQGKVQAAVSWSPDVYQAAEAVDGGHILASTKEASALIADVFISRGDFATKHPDLIAKFLLGWFEGVDAVNKAPEKSYPIMADVFEGVEVEDAKGMFGDVKLPSYAENLQFFEALGNDELRGYNDIYNEANTLWRKLGKTSGRTQGKDTVNTKYLLAIRGEAEKLFGEVGKAKKATKEFDFDFDQAAKDAAKTSTPILTKRISIFFPTGEYELGDNAKFILDEGASLAQTFGSVRMRVTGNTDNKGNRSSNIKLSEKRAQAVVDYMIDKHGFPKEKFVVIGAGPDKPVADNGTEEGRKQNRRTDFEIIK